jgi:hypothetical protein
MGWRFTVCSWLFAVAEAAAFHHRSLVSHRSHAVKHPHKVQTVPNRDRSCEANYKVSFRLVILRRISLYSRLASVKCDSGPF